jgi:nicotinate-nucleotide pyrophosphorylase (carboxylating)
MLTETQIEAWLQEDLGHHDVTNHAPGTTTGRLVAREPGVAAGLDAARAVFASLGVECEVTVGSGDAVDTGTTLLDVDGAAREVSEAVRVAGTRKTTPGLRGVEKRAIAAGGGDTHRLDLSHLVMVKDNHIAEMGMERAVAQFRERASFVTNVEVEVERPADGPRAAEAGADIVLFDNLPPAEVERGVALLPEGVLAEASGGITVEDVPDYAATGVDVISMGSLTHSAPALDLSFRTDDR